jgi:hypothetical protein
MLPRSLWKRDSSLTRFHLGIWNYKVVHASVAEMADAQGLGPCSRKGVEVRLLSLAVKNPR